MTIEGAADWMDTPLIRNHHRLTKLDKKKGVHGSSEAYLSKKTKVCEREVIFYLICSSDDDFFFFSIELIRMILSIRCRQLCRCSIGSVWKMSMCTCVGFQLGNLFYRCDRREADNRSFSSSCYFSRHDNTMISGLYGQETAKEKRLKVRLLILMLVIRNR